MPRPIWKGAITFGMVSIPVALYAATGNPRDVSLNMLHEPDLTRIRYLKWCPAEEREVSQDEIVRGYQYARDQYVVLTDEDLEQMPLPTRHTVTLSSFVKADSIDPIYYDRTYYLEPDPAGLKPYALLLRALTWKGLVGIGKVALRTREQVCALRSRGKMLVLETLLYADEVRAEAHQALPDVLVSQAELDMAFMLIDMLSGPFAPDQYRDEYQEALQRLIEAKLEGKEVVEAAAPQPAKVADLMSALKASVKAAKRPPEPARPRAARGKTRKAG